MQTPGGTPYQPPTQAPTSSADEQRTQVRIAIASRVRSDSEKSRLTCGPAVSRLVRQATNDETFVTGFSGVLGFEDIKAIVASDGSVYLYSDQRLSRQGAQNLLVEEEVRARVAERVRSDSSRRQRLTALKDLGMIPGAEPANIDNHLVPLLDDERYHDLRLISNSKGSRFLYSEDHVTATYASVLARAEANDPLATIAATVREESRIYPRPTILSTFAAPVFNIDPDRLEQYANEIIAQPEYADIRLVRASNGAVYLYSQTFLNSDWVKTTVEWQEVGRYENP